MKAVRNLLLAVHRGLTAVERWSCIVLMAAMFLLLLLQVTARYVFGTPLGWTEELARFTLVWLTFIGAALVSAEGEHISITIAGESVARSWRRRLLVAGSLVTAVGLGFIVPAAVDMYAATASVVSSGTGLARTWLFMPLTVGLALVVFHSLVKVLVPTLLDRPEGGASPHAI